MTLKYSEKIEKEINNMGKKEVDQIVGAAYEDLNAEDMQQIQGAGDVDAETAVPVIVTLATVASAIYSSKKC